MLDEKKAIKLLDLFILDAKKSVIPWVKETGRGLESHKELVYKRKNKIYWGMSINKNTTTIFSEITEVEQSEKIFQEFYMEVKIKITDLKILTMSVDGEDISIERYIHERIYNKAVELINLIKTSKEQIFNERINILSENILKEE
jgi:hypothetical protein